jgi:hypothetical protein
MRLDSSIHREHGRLIFVKHESEIEADPEHPIYRGVQLSRYRPSLLSSYTLKILVKKNYDLYGI